jgi:hypothetical protein
MDGLVVVPRRWPRELGKTTHGGAGTLDVGRGPASVRVALMAEGRSTLGPGGASERNRGARPDGARG